MFILCDKNNLVKSRSSHLENIGAKLLDDSIFESDKDIKVGDTFDGTNHILNVKFRAERELEAVTFELIENSIRKKECDSLSVTKPIPTTIKDFYDNKEMFLNIRITELEALVE